MSPSNTDPPDHLDPLTRLTDLLRETNSRGLLPLRRCAEMDKVHAELLKQARSGNLNYEPIDLQVEAVRKFWDKGAFDSLREARLVSFGLAVKPWPDRSCLMEEPKKFGAAINGLREWEDSPRQFRKCYQGLLRSYFDYDGMGRDIHPEGQKNWGRLQTYLDERANLIKDVTINPDWVTCTLENKALFSKTPCAEFAQDVLEGREDNVKLVRNLLGISDASWFTRELVFSQIASACEEGNSTFRTLVERLLKLLGDNEVLRDPGLQMLLNRYAQIPQKPQHHGLRDYSVDAWGNPSLPSNKHKWVGVSDEARNMVYEWVNLELIRLFFTKLSEDGLSDERRLKFWTRYVPLIKSVRFALGSHARTSRELDYIELRKKLKGLTVPLEDNNQYNNAFVMTMGDLVAVEFSGTSNAFYGYNLKKSLPFSLGSPVRSSPVNGENSLKNDARVLYLIHKDKVHGYSDWEERFKYEFYDKFGLVAPRR